MEVNKRAIKDVSDYIGVGARTLKKYMNEAPYAIKTSWGKPYPSGTGRATERALLYALTRIVKPKHIVEFGTGWGASGVQFLSAIKANDIGDFHTYDITKKRFKRNTASLVPSSLYEGMTKSIYSAGNYPYILPESVELFFEDTDHSFDTTRDIYKHATGWVTEGGLMISHDAGSTYKDDVVGGIRANGIEPLVVMLEDNAPGLSIYKKGQDYETAD